MPSFFKQFSTRNGGPALIEPFRGDRLTVTLFRTPLPIAVLISLVVLGLSATLFWWWPLREAGNE